MIDASGYKEGEIITVSNHFVSDTGFYSDVASAGLKGNNWDVAEALKKLGIDENTVMRYATDIKSIPDELKTAINEKIKPKDGTLKFSIRNLETIKGHSKKVLNYNEKDFIRTLERMGFTREVYFEEDEQYIFEPVPSSLVQGIGYIGTEKRVNSKAWKNFYKKGVYGSVGKEGTYFSKDIGIALSHAPYENTELIEIDIPELAKYRQIFFDPESCYRSSEKYKNFVVMGGIPREAITKIYHLSKIEG